VLDELSPLVARLDVTVCADDVPDVQVACSPCLLHVLFANLCGNAVKFLEGQRDATAKRIVESRGGRIAVASTLGHGSRFSVWLPLSSAPGDLRVL